jgi:hypothetical protein
VIRVGAQGRLNASSKRAANGRNMATLPSRLSAVAPQWALGKYGDKSVGNLELLATIVHAGRKASQARRTALLPD